MAVEDVLAAKAIELDQQFGLATTVEARGILPALIVGAAVSVATARGENLKLSKVNVNRVLEVEAADPPQFDRSELWQGRLRPRRRLARTAWLKIGGAVTGTAIPVLFALVGVVLVDGTVSYGPPRWSSRGSSCRCGSSIQGMSSELARPLLASVCGDRSDQEGRGWSRTRIRLGGTG